MAWCPVCKCEYVDGVTTCADCGSELVDRLPAKTPDGAENRFDMEEAAMADNADFMEQAEKAAEFMEFAFDEEQPKPEARGVYMNNEERAEENRTSAYTLLTVGILGLIVVICVFFGIIRISLSVFSRYMICGVMGVMFLLFIVMGIISLRNFKVFKKRAVKENNLTEEIRRWLLENVDPDAVDRELSLEELPDEIKYFQRFDHVKNTLQQKFVNLDEAYVERLVEEMYEQLFEGREKE